MQERLQILDHSDSDNEQFVDFSKQQLKVIVGGSTK